MSACTTYEAGTVTAGYKSHAEGLKENAERDTAWTLYDKINEDLKKGLSSELKIRSDSRVCAFTRPNSTSPYMKGKLTDEELIVVDKIAPIFIFFVSPITNPKTVFCISGISKTEIPLIIKIYFTFLFNFSLSASEPNQKIFIP